MKRNTTRKERCLFIVWKGYQRRAEVLASYFDAEIKFIPHLFRSKWLRPLDYFYKLWVTVVHILRTRPDYALVQAPPHYAALPAILCRLPYILDAHNGVFQSYWHRLPLFNLVMREAKAVLVHNPEVRQLFHEDYPDKSFIIVADPLQRIEVPNARRETDKILFICSFDQDEPVDTIIEVIESVPEYTFVITAELHKLPSATRQRLEACANAKLTGFLSKKDYHEMLCTSTAAIALTNMVATQQSGACEALSSDTPLIATRSTLSEKLFGEWAILVDNTPASIIAGIRNLSTEPLHLEAYRTVWNQYVRAGVVSTLRDVLRFPAGAWDPDPEEQHIASYSRRHLSSHPLDHSRRSSHPCYSLPPSSRQPTYSPLSDRSMRVLLSAYACEPNRGSEEGFGWNWAVHLAEQGHDIWVLTRPLAREAIAKAVAERPIPNLHFVYVDIPGRYRRFIKGIFGVYAHYFLWQKAAYGIAREIVGRERIDVIHHVTWGSLIGGSWLWKIDRPFVFGPVGGGQVAPPAFRPYFATRWREESARTYITQRWLPRLKPTRRMLKRTALLLATNSETLAAAKEMGAPRAELFLDTGLPTDYFADAPKSGRKDEVMRILWVGRLLERKALRLSLEAVARLDIPFRMTILGDGPQSAQVLPWIEDLGLTGKVDWPGRVPWSEVQRAYEEHEVFLFSSIRDSFGSQLLEAMSNGLAIVTLDHQGAHDFVPDGAGIKVAVSTPQETAGRLAEALTYLYRNPDLLPEMSKTGLAFARSNEWSLKAERVTQLYHALLYQTSKQETVQ